MAYETEKNRLPEDPEETYGGVPPSGDRPGDVQTVRRTEKPSGNRRRKKRKRKKRRKKHYVLRFVLFCAVVLGAIVFLRSDFFTVELIKVENNSIITEDQILEMSGLETGQNIFHSSSLKAKKEIEKNPYIAHASVHRKLPNVLVIRVREKEAIASIEKKDEYVILDADGTVIDQSRTNMYTTVISGIKLKKFQVGEVPEVDNPVRLENALKLIRSVNDSGMYFKRLNVMSSLTVEGYLTDNLLCSGMPDDILENLEGIKVILYDLNQKGIERGTIIIGKDGLASFSPDST